MTYLLANWPAPPTVCALTTTRVGGQSVSPYEGNNLALHVEDNTTHVLANRTRLIQALELPKEPHWLEQTHSTRCVLIEKDSSRDADAAVTRTRDCPLVIMTADCLPILLCDNKGTEIAAIHAGWRGLANGIIENTLEKLSSPRNTLMAWIGPAICGNCYEVGEEMRQTFIKNYPFTIDTFQFKNTSFYANLAKIAEYVLNSLGVRAVFQSNACTFEQKTEFYSYRRQAQTGRMATLIWFKS